MDVTLVVVGGDAKPTEVNLQLPSVLGRGREASLTLPQALISRQHCEVYEEDGKLMVRDLGSLNGTFIGNQRITEAELPSGALLTVGTVTFRAVYRSAAGDESPTVAGMPAASEVTTSMPDDKDVEQVLEFLEMKEVEEVTEEVPDEIAVKDIIDGGEVEMIDDKTAVSEPADEFDFDMNEVEEVEMIESATDSSKQAAEKVEISGAAEEGDKGDDDDDALNAFLKDLE